MWVQADQNKVPDSLFFLMPIVIALAAKTTGMQHQYRAFRTETLPGNIWWRAFLDDPDYGHYKLKRLDTSLTERFNCHLSVVPAVGKEEFILLEKDRLPLLIGTQFSTSPRPDYIFNDKQNRVVAAIGFSPFSGIILGLAIHQYIGPKCVNHLHSIQFPKSIRMTEILNYPFPEVLQVEFGFKKQGPLYSQRAEIARTPIQHFQNMSYRDDFVPRKANLGRARSMLLVNEFKGATPMHLMSRSRVFDLGYFTFDAQRYMTGCGILPATETIGFGQSVRSIPDAFLLLTPIDYYHAFKKRYHGPVDWEGIRLSWRPLTFKDGNTAHFS